MVKVTQHSWLGGVLDRELMGRQDVDRYASGACALLNFLPQRRGSLSKRPGTDYIATLDGVGTGHAFRMIPFGFKQDDGRVLLITAETDFTTTPPSPVACTMKVYGRNGFVATVSGTLPPYKPEDLESLCPAQCGDVLFLASQSHPPAKVSHTDENAYTFEVCAFNPQPTAPKIIGYDFQRKYFQVYNWRGGHGSVYESNPEGKDWRTSRAGTTTVLYASSVVDNNGNESTLSTVAPEMESENDADTGTYEEPDKDYTGAIDNKASSDSLGTNGAGLDILGVVFYAPWTESQVVKIKVKTTLTDFREIRLYKDVAGTYGLVGIAAKNLCTAVSNNGGYTYEFTDDNIAPDTSISPLKDKPVFTTSGNWPAAVAVYQQRLVWASTRNDPARVWMSATGDFYQHRPHVTVQPDDPIDFILPITRFAKINFIVELRKLLMFSEACEWLVSSNSTSEGVAYDTIQATPHSYIGCDPRLPPIVANTNILFAERTGRAVRSYGYQLEDDGFGGVDISMFSASVFEGRKIIDWTYQQHPQPTVWCVLDDGSLASCVYVPDQQTCAWSTHRLGGGGKALAIACTWSIEGDTSTVLVAVQRGTDAPTLEAFRRPCGKRAAAEDALCLDSARALGSGADAPDGMHVETMPDGRRIAGYTFTSAFTSVYPAISDDKVGAAQFDVRTVQDVALRLRMGVGGTVRAAQAPEELAVPLLRTEAPPADADGVMDFPQVDERVTVAGVNDGDGRVTVEQSAPWPFEVVLMETDVDVEIPSEEA